MFRTLGALGIFINKELQKKDIRLLASKLDGTSIADSFTVNSKCTLFIWNKHDKKTLVRGQACRDKLEAN